MKHNPIHFFFTKAELVPIICRDQASPSISSANREKYEKIGRSDRLLHPEDRKKQSLIRLFSNLDKKKHMKKVTDQTATCFPF